MLRVLLRVLQKSKIEKLDMKITDTKGQFCSNED